MFVGVAECVHQAGHGHHREVRAGREAFFPTSSPFAAIAAAKSPAAGESSRPSATSTDVYATAPTGIFYRAASSTATPRSSFECNENHTGATIHGYSNGGSELQRTRGYANPTSFHPSWIVYSGVSSDSSAHPTGGRAPARRFPSSLVRTKRRLRNSTCHHEFSHDNHRRFGHQFRRSYRANNL